MPDVIFDIKLSENTKTLKDASVEFKAFDKTLSQIKKSLRGEKEASLANMSEDDFIKAARELKENGFGTFDEDNLSFAFRPAGKKLEDFTPDMSELAGKIAEVTKSSHGAAYSFEAIKSAMQGTTLGVKALNVGLGILKTTLNTLAIWAVTAAISAFVGWLNDLAHAEEIAAEKANEVRDALKKADESIASKSGQIEELSTAYEELSEKIQRVGGVYLLTESEQEKYHDTCNKIAELFPDLIKGYDSERNAIINLRDAKAELNAETEKQIKHRKEDMVASGDTLYKDFRNNISYSFYDKDSNTLAKLEAVNRMIDAYNTGSINDLRLSGMNPARNGVNPDLEQAFKDAGYSRKEMVQALENRDSEVINFVIQYASRYPEELEAAMPELRELVLSSFELKSADYNALTEDGKNVVRAYIDGLHAVDFRDYKTINEAMSGLSNALFSEDGAVESASRYAEAMQRAYDGVMNGTISSNVYKASLNNALSDIGNLLGEDAAKLILSKLNIQDYISSITAEAKSAIGESFKDDLGSLTLPQLEFLANNYNPETLGMSIETIDDIVIAMQKWAELQKKITADAPQSYDAFNDTLARRSEILQRSISNLDKAIAKEDDYREKISLTNKALDYSAQATSVYERSASRYQSEAEKIANAYLTPDLAKNLRIGGSDYLTSLTEDEMKWGQEYLKWYDLYIKALDSKTAEEERVRTLQQSIRELARVPMEQSLADTESQNEVDTARYESKAGRGDFSDRFKNYAANVKNFKLQRSILEDIVEYDEDQLSLLVEQRGEAAKQSDEYREIQSRIQDNTLAMLEMDDAIYTAGQDLGELKYRGDGLLNLKLAEEAFSPEQPLSEMQSALDIIDDGLYESGFVYSESFKAAWIAVMGDFDSYFGAESQKTAKQVKKEFENVAKYLNDGKNGATQFVTDLYKKQNGSDEYIRMNDDGSFGFLNANVEALAQEMNMSVTAVQAIIGALRAAYGDIGLDIFVNDVDSLNTALDEQRRSFEAIAAASGNYGQAMQQVYGAGGNVDLTNRPEIGGQKLIDAGWQADSIDPNEVATLFSNTARIGEDGEIGIIYTPITPDGEVMTPDAMKAYIESLGFNEDGSLDLSTDPKGLVVSSMDMSGVQENMRDSYLSSMAEELQKVQKEFYLPSEAEQTLDSFSAKVEEVAGKDIGDLGMGNALTATTAVKNELDTINQIQLLPKTLQINTVLSDVYGLVGKTNEDSPDFIGPKRNGPANARGTQSAKGGKTLVGELGPEAVVSGDTYRIVGLNGAEVVNLKPGDMVFNHLDTQEIFGTGAPNETGPARKDGFVKSTIGKILNVFGAVPKKTNDYGGGSNKKKGGRGGSDTSTRAEEPKWFDWIEVRLKRLADITEEWVKKAERAVGYSLQNAMLESAIANKTQEITNNQAGYERYLKQADGVALSSTLKEQVRNGEIDITQYDGDTQELINDYKQWYDKALECKTAVEDLKQEQRELAQQKLDNIIQFYDNRIDRINALNSKQNTYIDKKIAQGKELFAGDFEKEIGYKQEEKKYLQDQRETLSAEFASLVDRGLIEDGSDAWYEYNNKLVELDESILQSDIDIQDFIDKIDNIEVTNIQYVLDALDTTAGKLKESIEYAKQFGKVITEDVYKKLIASSEKEVENLKKQNALYTEQMQGLDVNSEKYQALLSKIVANEGAIFDATLAQGEWNDAIANIPVDRLIAMNNALKAQADAVQGMMDLHKAQKEDLTSTEYKALIMNGMQQIENLQEQNRYLEEQQSVLEAGSEKWLNLQDKIDGNNNAILDIKTSQEEWNDAIIDLKIDALEKQLDEINKINDAYEKEIALEKAQQELDRAKTQRNKRIYRENQGFVWEADRDAVQSAQDNYDKLYREQMLDKVQEVIDSLEDSKKDNNLYDYNANLIDYDGGLAELLANGGAQKLVDELFATGVVDSLVKASHVYGDLKNGGKSDSSVTLNIGNVQLDNVKDVDSFARDLVNLLPNSFIQNLYKK